MNNDVKIPEDAHLKFNINKEFPDLMVQFCLLQGSFYALREFTITKLSESLNTSRDSIEKELDELSRQFKQDMINELIETYGHGN